MGKRGRQRKDQTQKLTSVEESHSQKSQQQEIMASLWSGKVKKMKLETPPGSEPSEASPSHPRSQTRTSLRAALDRCKSISVTPRSPVEHVKCLKMNSDSGNVDDRFADYYIHPNRWPHITAAWRGDQNYLNTIESFLSIRQLDMLKERPFGNVMKLNNLKLSGVLLTCVLLSEVWRTGGDEMYFNFNGKVAEFSEKQFEKITGLRINPPRSSFAEKFRTTNGSSLLRKYFQIPDGKKGLKMTDLKAFMKNSRSLIETDLDAVMLAEVYILGRVLLGGIHDKNVKWKHIVYIENIGLFKTFNWGHECYNDLINSMRSVFKKGVEIKTANYHFVGFVHAFMVWIWSKWTVYREKYCDVVGTAHEPTMLSYMHKKDKKEHVPQFKGVKALLVDEMYFEKSNERAVDEGNHNVAKNVSQSSSLQHRVEGDERAVDEGSDNVAENVSQSSSPQHRVDSDERGVDEGNDSVAETVSQSSSPQHRLEGFEPSPSRPQTHTYLRAVLDNCRFKTTTTRSPVRNVKGGENQKQGQHTQKAPYFPEVVVGNNATVSKGDVLSNANAPEPETRSGQSGARPTKSMSLNLTRVAALMNDYLSDPEEIESRPGDLSVINGYRVKQEAAPILEKIFCKYGDIARHSSFTSTICSSLLEFVCDIYKELKETDFLSITPKKIQSMLADVRDLESAAKIDVGWLSQRLNDISQANQLVQDNCKLKEAKTRNLVVMETNKKEQDELKKELAACIATCRVLEEKISKKKDEFGIAHSENEKIMQQFEDTKAKVKGFIRKTLVHDLL